MDQLQREMNRLFDSTSRGRVLSAPSYPAINIWTNDEGQLISAEMPGVHPDDINIDVIADALSISGERKPDEVAKDANYHRQERGYGSFSRTIQLPFMVDPNKGLFYCYGCGRGGDVIRFAELYHQVRFRQALALLREWCGLAPLLGETTAFYCMQLHRHSEAVRYLHQRGIRSPEIIEHMFSAVVIMALVTTLMTPPVLKQVMNREWRHKPPRENSEGSKDH